MYLSALSIPTRFDTSDTVIGLSPEITLICTPLSLNHFIVVIASLLTLSAIIINASAEKSSGIKSSTSEDFDQAKFKNPKYYVSAQGTQDLIISRFESEKYGEAYLLTNFSELRDKTNKVEIVFKDCKEVAIYGGIGFDGEPKIVALDKNGGLKLDLVYGDGVFITPIAK